MNVNVYVCVCVCVCVCLFACACAAASGAEAKHAACKPSAKQTPSLLEKVLECWFRYGGGSRSRAQELVMT